LFWTDHPQWAANKTGLRSDLQHAFRSPNCYHFVKSAAHAYELSRILGWPNCFECPVAADPEQLEPAVGIEPEYDVIAIYDGQREPSKWMDCFVEQDNPDPQELSEHYTDGIRSELSALWDAQNVPPRLNAQLRSLGERLMQYRLADPLHATARSIPALADEFPQAMGWLTFNHTVYFAMAELMWRYRGWQREFMVRYLSRRFRVAVLGGSTDFAEIPSVLARGKIVINCNRGCDEEGLTAETFEIAASGGAALVQSRVYGLSEHFEIGREVEMFDRPSEAAEVIGALLADNARRQAMSAAARARVERDHSWDSRIERLLAPAGMKLANFRPPQSIRLAAAA